MNLFLKGEPILLIKEIGVGFGLSLKFRMGHWITSLWVLREFRSGLRGIGLILQLFGLKETELGLVK